MSHSRWDRIASRLVVHPLGLDQARPAHRLRRALAVAALDQRRPVIVFTSDVDDLSTLLADQPHVTVERI
jgi:hypothetical protein